MALKSMFIDPNWGKRIESLEEQLREPRKFYARHYVVLVIVLTLVALISFAEYFFDSILYRSIFTLGISLLVFFMSPIAGRGLLRVLRLLFKGAK